MLVKSRAHALFISSEVEARSGTIPSISHHTLNLDAMSRDELWAFFQKHQGGRSREDAASLVGDKRANYTTIARDLVNYAMNKSVAMGCRERGELPSAEIYESICESIYKRLPADLKW